MKVKLLSDGLRDHDLSLGANHVSHTEQYNSRGRYLVQLRRRTLGALCHFGTGQDGTSSPSNGVINHTTVGAY